MWIAVSFKATLSLGVTQNSKAMSLTSMYVKDKQVISGDLCQVKGCVSCFPGFIHGVRVVEYFLFDCDFFHCIQTLAIY